jgi:hypothetical protein
LFPAALGRSALRRAAAAAHFARNGAAQSPIAAATPVAVGVLILNSSQTRHGPAL